MEKTNDGYEASCATCGGFFISAGHDESSRGAVHAYERAHGLEPPRPNTVSAHATRTAQRRDAAS